MCHWDTVVSVITGSSVVCLLRLILNRVCAMFALTLCLGSAYCQVSCLCVHISMFARFFAESLSIVVLICSVM